MSQVTPYRTCRLGSCVRRRSRFLTRDPLETLTRSAYGYVNGNPLNTTDPLGLYGFPNPISTGFNSLGDKVGGAISGTASDVSHWATTNIPLPNSRLISGTINIAVGVYKVETGVILVVAGTAADVTGVGALLGVPAQAYGDYQITTGAFRITRGVRQVVDPAQDPMVCKSPLRYGADILLDLAPGGGSIENLLGALP